MSVWAKARPICAYSIRARLLTACCLRGSANEYPRFHRQAPVAVDRGGGDRIDPRAGAGRRADHSLAAAAAALHGVAAIPARECRPGPERGQARLARAVAASGGAAAGLPIE